MIWDMIYLFRFFVLESTYHIIFNFDRTSQKNQRLNGQKYDSNPRPETFPYIYIYIHIAFLVPVVPHMLRISHFGSVSRSAVSRLDLRTGTGMGWARSPAAFSYKLPWFHHKDSGKVYRNVIILGSKNYPTLFEKASGFRFQEDIVNP